MVSVRYDYAQATYQEDLGLQLLQDVDISQAMATDECALFLLYILKTHCTAQEPSVSKLFAMAAYRLCGPENIM